MKRLAYRPFISAAQVVAPDGAPEALGAISFEELCSIAGVKLRVSQERAKIECARGQRSFLVGSRLLVGGAEGWPLTRTDALRVLETLAYGLHDYAARECVCGRGLFSPPRRRGRPPVGARAKTAKERVAAMRARQRAAT